MIPHFVEKKFLTELYTIEQYGVVGDRDFTLYSTGGQFPSFVNDDTHGIKTWKSIRDVKLHLRLVRNDYVNHMVEDNASVYKYTYNNGCIAKEFVSTIRDLVME